MAIRRERAYSALNDSLASARPEHWPPVCGERLHDWHPVMSGVFRCATCLAYGFARTKPGRYAVSRVVVYKCSQAGCSSAARLLGRKWSRAKPVWRCPQHADDTAPAAR